MKWFAAHLVLSVKLKNVPQEKYPVWENIVLIEADTEEDAFTKAEQRGREEEGDDDGTFRWNGQPATWHFAGVRKLCACVRPEERPGDGTEVSYLELELPSEAAIADLVEGRRVTLVLDEGFRDENEECEVDSALET